MPSVGASLWPETGAHMRPPGFAGFGPLLSVGQTAFRV